MLITSHTNPAVVAARKLLTPKERKATGLFLAEGLKAVGQAMDSSFEITQLFWSEAVMVSDFGRSLLERAQTRGIPTTQLSADVFSSMSRKDDPQGIAAVVRQKWSGLLDLLANNTGKLAALVSVQNPGNLGTVLRTCDATGTTGLILLDESTDPYDPAAVKASMGSVFTVPVAKGNYAAFTSALSETSGLSVIGTSDQAAENVFETAFPEQCLLLFGSERQGLPQKYLDLCQKTVRIPMAGSCDSLNLSVAAGIILYQASNSTKKD